MTTIEEKARRYDEAMERAKNFIENGDEGERTVAENIFAGLMEVSEDEKRIENILSVLDAQMCWDGATGKKMNPYQKEIDWLKFLKDKITWKPTSEQMKVLKEACVFKKSTATGAVLCELYHDLEKLREG